MEIICDSSAALAVLLKENEAPRVQAVTEIYDSLIVPDLWLLEVANILNRKTQNDSELSATLFAAALTMITSSQRIEKSAAIAIQALATRTGLTSYDASYLYLAKQQRLPLLTLDKQMIAAASAEGVTVLPDAI